MHYNKVIELYWKESFQATSYIRELTTTQLCTCDKFCIETEFIHKSTILFSGTWQI